MSDTNNGGQEALSAFAPGFAELTTKELHMRRKGFHLRCLFTAVSVVSVCCLAAGCGGHGYELAPVQGTVLCNGKPMSPGSTKAIIIFSPIAEKEGDVNEEPGKSGSGTIDANGKFVLGTFGEQDGAIVGKHRVRVSIAAPEDDDGEEGAEASQTNLCGGLVTEPGTENEKVFEVVAGKTNEFTVDISTGE